MGKNDLFAIFRKLDHFEVEVLLILHGCSFLLVEMTHRGESFNTIWQGYDRSFIGETYDGTVVNRTNGKYRFEYIPWILFQLFVTQT